jgi:hypothetical protein
MFALPLGLDLEVLDLCRKVEKVQGVPQSLLPTIQWG